MLHVLVSRVLICILSFGVVFDISLAADKDYQKEGAAFAKKKVGEIRKLNLEEVLEKKEHLKAPKGQAPKGQASKGQASEGETVDEKSCKNCHVNLENPMEGLEKEMDGKDSILVFVSFSMPNIAINELSGQAEKYGAKIILRGLHDQSFQKTAKKIFEINKDGLKLDINPELFKKYEIKKVPTFILIKKGKEVSRLSGNVSLEYAKSKLVEE